MTPASPRSALNRSATHGVASFEIIRCGQTLSLRVGRCHDVLLCRPLSDVLPADGGRDQFGKPIGCAGECGDAQRAKGRRRVVIETGRAVIAQRQQRDHVDAAAHDRGRALDHLLTLAAFV